MGKVRADGAQRSCTPEDTLARMRPHFEAAGIARVGMVTGLDRLGIPVAQCIRPDAEVLSVDSGKGATPDAAMCSAVMEGFERCVGERWVPPDAVTMEPDSGCEVRFPLVAGAVLSNARRVWTRARGVMTGRGWRVPLEVVRMVARQGGMAEFSSSSNGLSSGNTFEEAVAGGLYEVVERDAVHLAFARKDRLPDRVDLDSIRDEVVGGLVERFRSRGCMPVLLDVSADTGVPVYVGYLFDVEDPFAGIYRGYAAHLDPDVAMSRALCEAAQGRAVYIAGSRDDLLSERYGRVKAEDGMGSLARLMGGCRVVRADRHEDGSTESFAGDVAEVCGRLERAGVAEPLVVEMENDFPCSVVRVMVPGLEGYWMPSIQSGGRVR